MMRLLGDMRSYNYVIVPVHDFDHVVYKIRSIDFDQQSYEGKFNVYRPQYFKENNETINKKSINLIENNIIPIICVGETLQEKEKQMTKEILKKT